MNKYVVGLVLTMALGVILFSAGIGNAQTKAPAKPPAKAPAKTPEAARVDVNKAAADQLTKCGISATLAKGIVEYREKSGPFKSPEDLMKVKGMNKELFNKLNPKMEKGSLFITPAVDDEEPDLKPSKC
ncbi:MAG TPA: helix-hairpin-helix domain-containing protein [Desulfatiglandales bacterium]|nr:helix-hairpin-helix domain-containing protein [Desulfatiglandales bacterium]